MVRPKSCMVAPMPTARRVGEKRLSAATSSCAECVAPLASVTRAASVSVLTCATPSPAISVMSPCLAMLSCTSCQAARRIRWLDTSQPSSLREVRPWPITIENFDGPFSTCASRSGDSAAGLSASMRSSTPSRRSVAAECWLSAISRPSKAGFSMASAACCSTTAIDRPRPESERARHRPAGPAPLMRRS